MGSARHHTIQYSPCTQQGDRVLARVVLACVLLATARTSAHYAAADGWRCVRLFRHAVRRPYASAPRQVLLLLLLQLLLLRLALRDHRQVWRQLTQQLRLATPTC